MLLEKIRPLNSIEEETAKEFSMQSGDFGIKEMDKGRSDAIISIRFTEYQLDENYRIISIDDAFTELTGYTRSFSCRIIEVPEDHDEIEVMEILKQADELMYEQKKEHKKIIMSC